MTATTSTANGILSLLLTATNFANIADNAASSPATNLYVSLHTAAPGVGGTQESNETVYTGYARIAVARTAAGWTVAAGTGDNDGEIAFGQCSASPATITHVGLGLSLTGAGVLLAYGEVTGTPIVMQVGTTPIISAGQLDVVCS